AVADADVPPAAAAAEQAELLGALATALAGGDLDAVVALLHPDVVMVGDGGGKAPAAGRPLRGPREVANFLLGLSRIYGIDAGLFEPVLVNGELGTLVRDTVTADGRKIPLTVSVAAIRDGRIWGLYNVANPDKLTRLPETPATSGTQETPETPETPRSSPRTPGP
ncbi:MAG TPA: nuclear transport factor 2 family protein, partial [Pseudonocardiaceae bacterium]